MLDPRYNELRRWLKSGPVEVEFTNRFDEYRKMLCTIKSDMVAEAMKPGFNYVDNDDTFTVWDLENSGWRSFKPTSVRNYFNASPEYDGVVSGVA